MSKEILVNAVAASCEKVTKADASKIVDAVIDAITEGLVGSDSLTIVNFGTFKKTHKEAHTGRNPSTGAPVEIPAKNRVSFSAAKAFKTRVNS